MFIRNFGPVLNAIPQPLWAGEDEGAGGAGAAGTSTETKTTDTPIVDGNGTVVDQNGSVDFDAGKTYAALDEDTRKWLQTKDLLSDPVKLAKSAREQEKLLGGMVKLPGKDATPEERDAFLNKLGRPATADGYEFTPPKDLPADLPYDAERASQLKTSLHALGLTKEQGAAIHDMYVKEIAGFAGGAAEQQQAKIQQKAEQATEALVKRWGPLDGDKAKANFEVAGRVFTDVPGGSELLAELQSIGLVGPDKTVLSEPVAVFLSNIGTALFTEDGVLRGRPDEIGNPFAAGEGFNLTQASKIVKEEPDRARSLIAAAGKKPSDFGLT